MGVYSLSKSGINNWSKYSNIAGSNGQTSDFELISSQLLTSAQASVTFNNLQNYSQYRHLQLRYTARSSRSVSYPDTVSIQLNGDTAVGNYRWHLVGGDSSAVASYNGQLNPAGLFAGAAAGGSSNASAFAANIVDILDFASTSKNKTMRAFGGSSASTGFDNEVRLYSSLWMSTAATTSLTIAINSSNNFATGSRFSLYGVK